MGLKTRIALIALVLYLGLLAFVWQQTPTATVENKAGEYIHVFFGATFIKNAILGYIFILVTAILGARLYRWFSKPRSAKPKPPPQKGPYLKPRKPL